MCNVNNYNEVMKELAEMKAMQNEIKAAIDALQGELQQYMLESGQGELQGIEHKATYKEVTTTRLDQKALKLDHPEIVDKYNKTTTGMRFTFN